MQDLNIFLGAVELFRGLNNAELDLVAKVLI